MISELHAAAFLVLLVVAALQVVRSRSVSPLVVYSGLALSLSLRAMIGPEAHLQGLLGLLAGLAVALLLLAAKAADGSDLRLLLMAGAFLGARDTLLAALIATGVTIVAVAGAALLQRASLRGVRVARVLLTPYSGVGWSGGRVVLTQSAEATAARATPVSPGLAIVVGAMASWIL